MKKGKVRRLLLFLLLLVAIALALYHYLQRHEKPTDSLQLYGNVDIRQIQLAFHATGRIQDLLVQEGDRVKSGQLLARLDSVRYEAAASQARAQVAAQKEILARLLAGSRPEEIAEARARVKAAEATLIDAKLEYGRTKELAQTRSASQQRLDNAEAALSLAQAKLDEARQSLGLAVKGPRQEDIAAARAQLRANEAALRLAEKELSDTSLYAPADGVIQDRILEPGDMAFPQTPVYTLALIDPIWVRAYVTEPDLGKITYGMQALVTTDSFPGKVYRGWIGFISPTSEFTPKQIETTELRSRLVYRVRVYVCNPENELRLGMPVSVAIPLNQPKDTGAAKGPDPCREP